MRVAFTLAEVLVTLTILGILASIIVPNVVQQYQKRVTITKLKKAYSVLESAAANMAATTGCIGRTVQCTGLLDMPDKGTQTPIIEIKKLSVAFQDYTGIQGKIERTSSNPYNLYCTKEDCSDSDRVAIYHDIITKDGISYSIRISQFSSPRNGSIKDKDEIAVYVKTDLSKNAEPILGKNVFTFVIYDNFIVEPAVFCHKCGSTISPLSKPDSVAAIEDNCDVTKKQPFSGVSCLAKIVKDGWKINY